VRSPRYRWPKLGEFDETDGVFPAVVQEVKRRSRKKRTTEGEEFEVSSWRLPERWRKDARVGDDVIRKMTAGCDERAFDRRS
jgi:hypothetical protein